MHDNLARPQRGNGIEIDYQPYPDLWRGWFAERRVVYFFLGNGKRHAMQVAVTMIVETVEAWPAEKPFRVVYDVSRAFLSPFARAAADRVYEAIPTHFVNSRTAILLPDTVSGNLFRGLLERFMKVHNPNMERCFFTYQRAALDWTASNLD